MRAKQAAGLKGRLSAGDLYALVFLPGRAKREVLTVKGEKYYNQNKGVDMDHNGDISKTDLARRIRAKYVSDSSFV